MGNKILFNKTENGLTISVSHRVPSNAVILWSMLAFVLMVSGVSTLVQFTHGKFEGSEFLVGIALVFWAFFQLSILYALLWNIFGRELITVEKGELSVKRDLLGLGPTRRYSTNEMNGLRYTGLQGSLFGWGLTFPRWVISDGAIAFEYKGRLYNALGIQLNETQASLIIGQLSLYLEESAKYDQSEDESVSFLRDTNLPRHYGFSWWGKLLWGGTFLLAIVQWYRMLFESGFPLIPFDFLYPLLLVLWAPTFFTPVTLDSAGIWVRFSVIKKFVPWADVQQLEFGRWSWHRISVQYISPIHWFIALPLRQSFPLVVGLAHRNELFWEIHRRASRAQGREIPVKGWK